jgi:RNA-binding protein YlmH
MNEEQRQKGRLSDLAKRAYQQNIYTYSSFLSPAELSLFEEIRGELSYIPCEIYGGNPLCERQMIGFGSQELFGYPGHFPITVIQISPLLEKFSDPLTHRDYLGALMHLGIERDTLGDILIKDKTAYLFCQDSIADYILQNLTKVKHTNVVCTVVNGDIPALAPTLVSEEFPVSSLRMDSILASLLHFSRKEALTLFEERLVTLNGKITGRNSQLLKEGDVFSVRGHGKFIFSGTGGTTRKGKLYVQIQRYV